MLVETFNALMEEEEWKYKGKPDTRSMMSPDPDFNWKKHSEQNQYQRGICIIGATDEEIEAIDEDKFPEWFEEHRMGYHFYEDWKKKFKGSEFLIPVVERELDMRKLFTYQEVEGRLLMVKHGNQTIDEVISHFSEYLDEQRDKNKA